MVPFQFSDQQRVESQAANAEAERAGRVRREWHGGGGLAGQSELDSLKGWCSGSSRGPLDAELTQQRPTAGHQPFSAWLVSRERGLVEDGDSLSGPSCEQRAGRPCRPGADNDDIEIGLALRHEA